MFLTVLAASLQAWKSSITLATLLVAVLRRHGTTVAAPLVMEPSGRSRAARQPPKATKPKAQSLEALLALLEALLGVRSSCTTTLGASSSIKAMWVPSSGLMRAG